MISLSPVAYNLITILYNVKTVLADIILYLTPYLRIELNYDSYTVPLSYTVSSIIIE
jgi:hypothetical protein